MPRAARIDAVVVNHNAGSLLADAVMSLLDSAAIGQICLVDNASTDHSLEALEQAVAPTSRLTLLRNSSNTGFAAACNLGSRHTDSPWLLFMNPDCILAPGTVERLQAALEAHPEAGMAGGLLLNPDGSEQPGGRRMIPTPWRSFIRTVGLSRLANRWPRLFADFNLHRQPLPDGTQEVEAISGAIMLVRRAALEQVGPWDEGYFLHCEDLDLCWRFRQTGWPILFVPDAPVTHFQGTCSRQRPYFVEWHKHRGMIRFYRKFFRAQYPRPLMGLVMLGVWLRFALVASRITLRRWVG